MYEGRSMIKVIAALAAALALSLLATFWALSSRGEYKATAEALASQLEAAEARMARVQTALYEARQERETSTKTLKEALRAEPEWSGAPVPVPVSDGLCEHLRCK